MSEVDVFAAIRARFTSEVATPAALEVVHDNGPEPRSAQKWARFSVQVDGNQQVSMGARRYRMTGTATAIFFGVIGKKDANGAPLLDAELLELASSTVLAFRGARIASPDITFTPAPGLVGLAEQDNAWCRRTVRIPFRADVVE